MRGHLVKCLQNLQFQPFPKVQKRRAIKIVHVAYDLKVSLSNITLAALFLFFLNLTLHILDKYPILYYNNHGRM